MKAAILMHDHLPQHFFSDAALRELTRLVEIDVTTATVSIADIPAELRSQLEVLVTGWGVPELGPAELDAFPRLRAVVHAAGTVRFLDEEAWRRGILVSSAAAANAVPVAEFTLAMITLAGKDAFWVSRRYSSTQRRIDREEELAHVGNFGRTVGIVGASRVGARVLELLAHYDVEPLLFDPFCSRERASALGAELVDDLEELARRSSILSIHAPSRPETRGLISSRVLSALPDDATIINTARPDLIDQEAMIAELAAGRLRAILDVTQPEVLERGSLLYELSNVFLTPHLAGAAGNELRRLGDSAVAEVRQLVAGEPLRHLVRQSELASMA